MSLIKELKELNNDILNSKTGSTYYNYYLHSLESIIEKFNQTLTPEIYNFIDDIRYNLDMLDLENNEDFFIQKISNFIDNIKNINTENYTIEQIKFSVYLNFENSNFNSEDQYLESKYFKNFISKFID